jgi:hypothetical protein
MGLVEKSLADVGKAGDNARVLSLFLISFIDELLELTDTGAFMVFHPTIQFDHIPDHVAEFHSSGLRLFGL